MTTYNDLAYPLSRMFGPPVTINPTGESFTHVFEPCDAPSIVRFTAGSTPFPVIREMSFHYWTPLTFRPPFVAPPRDRVRARFGKRVVEFRQVRDRWKVMA